MKIVIFTDTFQPQVNGVARTVGRITSFLESQNLPCLVFAPDGGSNRINKKNVYTFPSFDLPFYPECKMALPNTSQIKEALNAFQPDIIHVFTEFSMGFCGLKYAKDYGLPVVASYTTNFPQYLSYYKAAFLERWAWQYLRWFHNQCQLTYCPSPAIKSMLTKKGFFNLDTWGRGIDTGLFSPDKRSDTLRNKLASNKRLYFLYVGRLALEKDLDVLLKAWKIVENTMPEAQLVITGNGPIIEELKDTAGHEVIFTGYLHGEELAAVYASCDAFVFPSTTETFGNVVLEAMASGLPVIAPAAGGVKNLLIDGYNGIACQPRNYLDMASAVIKIAQNDGLRRELGSQALQYARKCKWDGVLHPLIESYEKVVNTYKQSSWHQGEF
ncbi:MAG: glycosyltransferase family 1 protein [Dehalobacterium sp.]